MSNRPSMDDYIDVAERILHFKEAHPDGSLQTIDWSVVEVAGKTFIVYRAAAYREPNDKRPGHGIAWEPFPGPTNFTKDSELMNAETAAWGRAIVALGLAANRKIASRQEVKARQAPSVPQAQHREPLATEKQQKQLLQLCDELILAPVDLADAICAAAAKPSKEFESLDAAYAWCERALVKLPARMVGVVEGKLRKMVGQKTEAVAS